MKKKILWLGLSFLLVVTLVLSSLLSSCNANTTTSTVPATVKTTATSTAIEEPQSGGTLTFYGIYDNTDPPSWDDVTTPDISSTDFYSNPFGESLLKGDINKYGPRGNNTLNFEYDIVSQWGQYYGPSLATSWELTTNPLGVVYHLRQGVMWTGNTNIGMAPRELTADDVAYHLNRNLTDSSIKAIYNTYIKSITATDKYTVTEVWSSYYSQWESPIGLDDGVQARIIPPEVVKAGADQWGNAVGTGPFILTDYTKGSYATYTKNPNYWGEVTINGKTYQEPFIDKIVYPIIPDESTVVASVRTGKIDIAPNIPMTDQSSLASSSPDMIMDKWLMGKVDFIRFNTIGSQYFNNKDVRRAMFVATDLQTIANTVYQGGDIYSFPFAKGIPEYTPIDQLPAQDQLLYKFDPTTAKQMLAAAGYPNGFTCKLTTDSSSEQADIASIIVNDWAKAGVTVQVDTKDEDSYWAEYNGLTYNDMIIAQYPTDDAWAPLFACRPPSEGCAVNDPVFNAAYDKAQATQNDADRIAQKKALGVYFIDNTFGIGFTNPYILLCYWPWIKNYYGEITAGNYDDFTPMASQLWIDQKLKTTLGY